MDHPYAPPAPASRPPFRWGKGLLHAFLAWLAIVVIFAVIAVVLPVADPQRFGEGVGRFSFFMGVGALGVSALAQTGRRVAAWVVGGLLAALVAGLLAVLTSITPAGGPTQPRPLPTDELVRAEGVLRHPSLAVSIPDPGPALQASPELARQLIASVPGSRAWVYGDTTTGEVLIVLLTAGTAIDEPTFAELFEGVARGQLSAMTSAGMVADERERSIRWSERRAHLYVVAGDAVHMRFDAFGLPGAETLTLVTAAPSGERFAALAGAVKVP